MHGTAFGPEREATDIHSVNLQGVASWKMFPAIPFCAQGPGWCWTKTTATKNSDDRSIVFTEGCSAEELWALSVTQKDPLGYQGRRQLGKEEAEARRLERR